MAPCSCEIDKSPVCRKYGGRNSDALILLNGSSILVSDWRVRRGGMWLLPELVSGFGWYRSLLLRRNIPLSNLNDAVLFSPSSVLIETECVFSTSLLLFSFFSCSCKSCCFCRVIGPVITSRSRDPWLLSESLSFWRKRKQSQFSF